MRPLSASVRDFLRRHDTAAIVVVSVLIALAFGLATEAGVLPFAEQSASIYGPMSRSSVDRGSPIATGRSDAVRTSAHARKRRAERLKARASAGSRP